jgi:hypothetical protein
MLSKEALCKLGWDYMVSSTPNVLYSKFRNNEEVRSLRDKYTIEYLINIIYRIDNQVERDLNDVTTAYAAVVGLTFFEHDEIIKYYLGGIRMNSLEWVEKILNRHFAEYVVERVKECHEEEEKETVLIDWDLYGILHIKLSLKMDLDLR